MRSEDVRDAAELNPQERRRLLERLLQSKYGEGYFYSLSDGQRLIWVAEQISPANRFFNFPVAIRIHSKLDIAKLERAFATLVQRHEALRTTFVFNGSQPLARVQPEVAFRMEEIDAPADEAAFRRAVEEQSRRPMNLEQGPLMRAILFRRSDEDTGGVLLLLWHHIIFDGWSLAVALTELATLYRSFVDGSSVELPRAMAYSEFVSKQRDWFASPEGARSAEHWRARIHDKLPPLQLPLDRPRPFAPQGASGSIHSWIPREPTHRLRELCRRESVSLYTILLTALQLLLHRYSGQSAICIQSPFAGRPTKELSNSIGYFVGLLPLIAYISPVDTVRELLARNAGNVREAIEHQHYPIVRAVSRSQQDRGMAGLSRLLFGLLQPRAPGEASVAKLRSRAVDAAQQQLWDFGGLAVSGYSIAPPDTPFDLDVEVTELEERLETVFVYNRDVFDRETVELLSTRFLQTLEAMVQDLDGEVRSLRWAEEDKRSASSSLTGPVRPDPDWLGIPEMFERQADRTPTAVAVWEGQRAISFAELERAANQMAHRLAELGVAPGDLVGVHLPRSIDFFVATLATLKACATYVPLDPDYPAQRLRFMLDDSAPQVVVTREQLDIDLAGYSGRLLRVDADGADLARQSCHRLDRELGPNDRLCILYTSGSTGVPKGVEALHGATVNRLRWMWEAYPFQPDDVCCANTPTAFVDSICEVFGPLLAGIPIVIADRGVVRDLDRFTELLADRGVTRLLVGPAQLRVFLEHPQRLETRLPRLQHWTVSGEALPPDLPPQFLESAPTATLLNLYGCSECAGDSCFHEIRGPWSRPHAPIGRPIANTTVHVLDSEQRPSPRGIAGEIYIGGAGLARGYFNRPEMTAERFPPDPLSPVPGARMFRTGDLGRVSRDGELEYLGRADRQIQIRGCRVELGEIEAVLRRSADVGEAAVQPHLTRGETRLTAYLVPRSGADLDEATVRRDVALQLPDYMALADIVFLEALPRTPNGKLDRSALGSMEAERASPGPAHPPTDLEQIVCAIFCDVLDRDSVLPHDNFFQLGGHSLSVARAAWRIGRALRVSMPIAWIFETPTAAELATRFLELPDGPAIVQRASALLAAAGEEPAKDL